MNNQSQGPEFKRTEDREAILKVLQEKLIKKKLTLEVPAIENKFCEIIKIENNLLKVYFQNYTPPLQKITVSGFINNFYSELSINVTEKIGDLLFICEPVYLRISSQKRSELRYDISPEDNIYLKNIIVQKNELDIRGKSIPVSYKIILEKFKSKFSTLADEVHLSDFENKEGIYSEVFKTGKYVFIPDSRNISSIENNDNGQEKLDIKKFYGNELKAELHRLSDHGRIGWVIYPISARISEKTRAIAGYIELYKKAPFDNGIFAKLEDLSKKIVSEFLDATVYEFKEKHRLLDLSRNGLRFETENRKLINALESREKFICDIFIKHQAPITVMAWKRRTKLMDDGRMQVCVKIQGETSRQDQMARYESFLKNLGKNHEPQVSE